MEKCDTSRVDFYKPNAVSKRDAQNWFKRFQSGNFDVKDEPRCGRPVTGKVDAILEKVQQDRRSIFNGIAEKLGIDYKKVLTHLKKENVRVKSEKRKQVRVNEQSVWAVTGHPRRPWPSRRVTANGCPRRDG
ncbi:Putative uncharacterized protein FLJ37770 [Eumeta japonica]|uniref:Mos1 transposase HTH domain-containing protein n=1 Tax=Eumeta variegata TaxID=151549 RepID=A0A4C1YSA8_EUMVA|nr:Putative uncharacterized protein FLJ37770 [Eumeta japonica]